MSLYELKLQIHVFDEAALILAANSHSIATGGTDMGDMSDDVPSCLQMLLDPADGLAGYVGRLSDIGVQIEESSCEAV